MTSFRSKQCRCDAYFLPSQRCKPALFGVPLLVGLRDGMSGRELYAAVWAQVARLLSARPPSQDQSNHATDCDDSLGYEFPFTLRLVAGGGGWCALCAWPRLCRGCALPSHDGPLVRGCSSATPRPRRRSGLHCPPSQAPDPTSPIAKAKMNRQNSARLGVDLDVSSPFSAPH